MRRNIEMIYGQYTCRFVPMNISDVPAFEHASPNFKEHTKIKKRPTILVRKISVII